MVNIDRLWWDEEIENHFYIVHRHLSLIFWSVSVSWIIFPFVFPNGLSILLLQSPYYLITGISYIFALLVEKKDSKLKSIFSIIYTNYISIVILYMANSDWKRHKVIFEMLNSVYVWNFEIAFTKGILMKNFCLAKHIFMWHYVGYFTGELEIDIDHTHHIAVAAIFFISNLAIIYKSDLSYEKFALQKNLQNVENRLKVIINSFPDGLIIYSEERLGVYNNINILNLLSCNKDEIISKIEGSIFYNDKKYSNLCQSNLLLDHLNLIFFKETDQVYVLGITKIDEKFLEWKASKIYWEDKIALALTVRLANHIIQLEQNINENNIKNVLLRSVSHELRTPITAITCISDELIEKASNLPIGILEDKLRIISISSKLLIHMINDLLDYSKMLAGVFSIQKSDFCITELIENTVGLIKIQAKKKDIHVTIRLDPLLPTSIYSDYSRLSQILLNLLSNSLKFTLKGYIEVTCLLALKNKIKFVVEDSGIGMEKNKIKELLNDFTSTSFPRFSQNGTGLGLSISNKIIEELGGSQISINSTPLIGSTFMFEIDALDLNPQNQSYTDSEDLEIPGEKVGDLKINIVHNSKQGNKVLIADDNDFNRMVLISLLNRYNISCSEACTGKESIRAVKMMDEQDTPFKLVIMDGSMPELDGWDATKLIIDMHKEGKLKYLPAIIGYSAFGSSDDVAKFYKSGISVFLHKPSQPEVIMASVLQFV